MKKQNTSSGRTEPVAPWDYESCAEYFTLGLQVVELYGDSTGIVKGLDRSAHGPMLINVKWDSSGIAALVHPSQIKLYEK